MEDKQYWDDVAKARKDIYERMISNGVSTVESKNDVNPFYNQIIDNGAIGLEFYYGLPHKLYTPLGYITITTNFAARGNREKFLKELEEDYGLVTMVEGRQESLGYFGPIYSITKLPWSKKELPLIEGKKSSEYIDYDAAMETYYSVNDLQEEQISKR